MVARLAAATLLGNVPRAAYVNIGVGFPEEVARVLFEAGRLHDLTFVVESGVIGGLPAPGVYFGAALCPQRIVSSAELFALCYARLDATCLGVLQADSAGNVNVSKRGAGPRGYVGPGGFIDLSTAADTIVFVSAWMAHGDIAVQGESMRIGTAGVAKFVDHVDEITFSGPRAVRAGKRVFYATHVGLFQLTGRGMELVGVMPGVDVRSDILDRTTMKVVLPRTGRVPILPRSLFSPDRWARERRQVDVAALPPVTPSPAAANHAASAQRSAPRLPVHRTSAFPPLITSRAACARETAQRSGLSAGDQPSRHDGRRIAYINVEPCGVATEAHVMKLDIVLCPIDLSAGAERALEIAADLCDVFGARLVLHHNLAAAPPGLSKSWEWDQSHQKDEPSHAVAQKRVETLMRQLPKNVRAEACITSGALAPILLSIAEQLPADLIVIATHGSSTEDHSSVAERVLERASCPVLAIHDTDPLQAFRLRPRLGKVAGARRRANRFLRVGQQSGGFCGRPGAHARARAAPRPRLARAGRRRAAGSPGSPRSLRFEG